MKENRVIVNMSMSIGGGWSRNVTDLETDGEKLFFHFHGTDGSHSVNELGGKVFRSNYGGGYRVVFIPAGEPDMTDPRWEEVTPQIKEFSISTPNKGSCYPEAVCCGRILEFPKNEEYHYGWGYEWKGRCKICGKEKWAGKNVVRNHIPYSICCRGEEMVIEDHPLRTYYVLECPVCGHSETVDKDRYKPLSEKEKQFYKKEYKSMTRIEILVHGHWDYGIPERREDEKIKIYRIENPDKEKVESFIDSRKRVFFTLNPDGKEKLFYTSAEQLMGLKGIAPKEAILIE